MKFGSVCSKFKCHDIGGVRIVVALICQGCHSKMPQTEWLKSEKFISSQCCRLEVQHESVGWLVSPDTSLPGLQISVFGVSSPGGSFVHTHSLCQCVLFSSSDKDTNQIGLGLIV